MVSGMAKLAVPRHGAYELHRSFHRHGRIFICARPERISSPLLQNLIFGTDRPRLKTRMPLRLAIVQCAVSVAASSSTGASSGTAAAVVVVSSHSIGSSLRVIAR